MVTFFYSCQWHFLLLMFLFFTKIGIVSVLKCVAINSVPVWKLVAGALMHSLMHSLMHATQHQSALWCFVIIRHASLADFAGMLITD